MRKNTSKSFSEKTANLNVLPPLQKRNTINEETVPKNVCSTARPPSFVIRSIQFRLSLEKISSFIQNSMPIRQNQNPTILQNKCKLVQYQKPIILSPNTKNLKKQQQCDKQNSRRITNSQDVSICRPQLQEFVLHQISIVNKNQSTKMKKGEKVFENISTTKSLMKKVCRKRKIQECKTHKINWGTTKTNGFDLAISAIKLSQDQNNNMPLQSLKQLYIQMI